MRLHTWQKLHFESACGYDHIWAALCNYLVRGICSEFVYQSKQLFRAHSARRAGGRAAVAPG